MSLVNEMIQEEHEKELEVLRVRIRKLEHSLGECAEWLRSARDIIMDADLGDEDDDACCLEIIKDAEKLLTEKVLKENAE